DGYKRQDFRYAEFVVENNKNGYLELTGGHSWDSIPDCLQNAIEVLTRHRGVGSTLKLALMGVFPRKRAISAAYARV
ncbi:hypothetical protein, partial [Escherichia coli]|uniref:hypothetical protein n=1 Tax=Escherichia coli TaxID=562 RepID=UPI00197AFD48